MKALRLCLAAVVLCSGLSASFATSVHAEDSASTTAGVRFTFEIGKNADLTSSALSVPAGATAIKVVNGETVGKISLRAMVNQLAKLKAQGRGAVGRLEANGKRFAIVGSPKVRTDGTVRMRIKVVGSAGDTGNARSSTSTVQYTSCPSGTQFVGSSIEYGSDGSIFESTECMSSNGLLILNTYIPPPA